jgi:hypothetical protein
MATIVVDDAELGERPDPEDGPEPRGVLRRFWGRLSGWVWGWAAREVHRELRFRLAELRTAHRDRVGGLRRDLAAAKAEADAARIEATVWANMVARVNAGLEADAAAQNALKARLTGDRE